VSFRTRLLALSRSQALKLYDEVFRKIEESYVDPIEPAKLFRAGVDHLLVACEDDQFKTTNLSGASPEDITHFRDRLKQWKTFPVRDRPEATRHLGSIANQAEATLAVKPTPVIMEFIYGASCSLDDYSTCLTPDRLSDLYAVIDGSFVGIGVELRSDDAGLLIVNVLAGGPAAEAGMRSGDHIVAIDSLSTVGLPTDEAANRLQGAEGSQVQLWVHAPDEPKPRRVILRRRSSRFRACLWRR